MNLLYWLFVIAMTCFVLGMAIYVRRFIRDVVDYLAAGRLAGRYVLCVAGMESALGLMALISLCEVKYRTGLAIEFWNTIMLPLGTILSLTGFCIYRYRQTKSLSMGEFLEKRYSRSFRVIAMILRTTAEMLTNTIGPAISARVFIYLFGWPSKVNILGFQADTFMLVMAVTLAMSMVILFSGGMTALVVTDCLQGLICYPIFVIFTIYILHYLSWDNEIVPTMLNRVPGESFFNPYDIDKLRDFNLFALIVIFMRSIVGRGAWMGGGSTAAARSPHEQKMAGVLGTWRAGFSTIMTILLALSVITVLNHPNHAKTGAAIRQDLVRNVAMDILPEETQRQAVINAAAAVPAEIDFSKRFSDTDNPDTPYLTTIHQTLSPDGKNPAGNAKYQEFRSLFHQMMMPVTMRHILPGWMMALLCLLLILLMVSTDDSKMFSSSLTIAQDIILPFRKTPMPIKKQLMMIRLLSLGVALTFFVGSIFLSQLDYVQLYITIMVSIWTGGAGPVVLFGLYSRFGNTWGAYASLLFGSGTSLTGVLIMRNWAETVYPFLERHGLLTAVTKFLHGVSAPFEPYISWKMNPVKCPVNSYEFLFLAMIVGTLAYLIVSYLTTKRGERFDLDKMLHRDERPAGAVQNQPKLSIWARIAGISQEYTKGDRIITWCIFFYSVIWRFFLIFIGVIIWNKFQPWSTQGWSRYFFWTIVGIPAILGVVTTVWFFCGGIRDMRQLFRDLAKRKADATDNGFVVK